MTNERTIWKWNLNNGWPDSGVVSLANPVVRSVAMQDGSPCIWIEHTPNAPQATKTNVAVRLVGTGHMVPDRGEYAGMFIDGPFVGHVYVEMTPTR